MMMKGYPVTTMASEKEDMAIAATASDSKNNEEQQTGVATAAEHRRGRPEVARFCHHQNLVSRVASVSLSAACEMVSTTYSSIKESIPVFRSICDVAETGVRTIASAAVSGVQPLLSKPQTADIQDSQSLDKVEEKESVAQEPADQVTPDLKEPASSTQTATTEAVCQTVAEVKETVSGMVDLDKEVVQGSAEMTKMAVTSDRTTVMRSSIGQMASSVVDAVIGKSEEMVDHYLPMTDEELATIAISLEVLEVSSVEKQRQPQSYYVRLGSLSTKVRQRAYLHGLGKLRHTKQTMEEALSQLQQAIDLIAFATRVDQKAHNGQGKLWQMWLEWSKSQPEQGDSTGVSQAEQMESQALGLSNNIAQQMQSICQSLLANMQGFPSTLQEKVQQAYSYVEELQATFSSAKSFQDLPSVLLTQSREKLGIVQQAADEVLEFVMQNTPLTWVVGPFFPAGTSPSESVAGPPAAEVPPPVKECKVGVQKMESSGSGASDDQA
ncbi:perilipin-3-like isoform X5 [Rhineura floridana]|uniref:perilipin-3-like isoform X5 n=1 Tax=Rhineura floridana TaxID=261503 RepID=UPI002AC85864|nr:perilipin-3-like isoform X5 [Rhineura floridana]